jgi:hypothetical protein
MGKNSKNRNTSLLVQLSFSLGNGDNVICLKGICCK